MMRASHDSKSASSAKRSRSARVSSSRGIRALVELAAVDDAVHEVGMCAGRVDAFARVALCKRGAIIQRTTRVPAAARNGLQVIICELIALLLGERQQLLGARAGLGLFPQLRADVQLFEIHGASFRRLSRQTLSTSYNALSGFAFKRGGCSRFSRFFAVRCSYPHIIRNAKAAFAFERRCEHA